MSPPAEHILCSSWQVRQDFVGRLLACSQAVSLTLASRDDKPEVVLQHVELTEIAARPIGIVSEAGNCLRVSTGQIFCGAAGVRKHLLRFGGRWRLSCQ